MECIIDITVYRISECVSGGPHTDGVYIRYGKGLSSRVSGERACNYVYS